LITAKEVTEKVHTAEDLDTHGQKILDLLDAGGQSILDNLMKVFLKMVFDASQFIGSIHYIAIIQVKYSLTGLHFCQSAICYH